MPNFFQPVLANLEAIIQAIVLLVILASGAVRMFRESKQAQERAERQRRQPLPEQGGDGVPQMAEARGPQPPRQAPQETIRSEVEEFLRRVGSDRDEGREQPPDRRRTGQRQQRQPRIEVLDADPGADSGFEVDERPREQRRRSFAAPLAPQAEAVRSSMTQARTEGIERGESVAEHVATHLKRGAFAERASQMGEELSQTDERLEARLHQKFDHGLGSLSARRLVREAEDLQQKGRDEAPSVADGILELLSTPQGVQQAVILNEVLSRPIDRW